MLLPVVFALFYMITIGAAADHTPDDTIMRTRAFMFDLERKFTQLSSPTDGFYLWLHWSHDNKHHIKGIGRVTDEKLILLRNGKEKEIAIQKQVPDCKIRGATLSPRGDIAIAWQKMNHENTMNVSLFHLMGLKQGIVLDDATRHEVSHLRLSLRKKDESNPQTHIYTLSFGNMLFTPNGSHVCVYLPMKYIKTMGVMNHALQEPDLPYFWNHEISKKSSSESTYEHDLDALFESKE